MNLPSDNNDRVLFSISERRSSRPRTSIPRQPQRVMVELTMSEAEAVSALLNGLGWGPVDSVRAIVSARNRHGQAITVRKEVGNADKAA